MSRPHGRARVSSTNPQAQAVCDRCGIWYNLVDLRWQFEWNGMQMYNKQLLFCRSCLDVPQQQLRTVILAPDPLPVQNARVEPFTYDNTGPVNSRISQDALHGATIIYVQSVTGFAVGNSVNIQLNNGAFATEQIVSIDSNANSMMVSIPLPFSASTNGIVTVSISQGP